jgi:hypothetical protein
MPVSQNETHRRRIVNRREASSRIDEVKGSVKRKKQLAKFEKAHRDFDMAAESLALNAN